MLKFGFSKDIEIPVSSSSSSRAACESGDRLSFLECSATKGIGFCRINFWLLTCEATCGNTCEKIKIQRHYC